MLIIDTILTVSMNQKSNTSSDARKYEKQNEISLFGPLNSKLTLVKTMGFTKYFFHSPSPQPHSLSAMQIQIKECSGAHVSGAAAF